MCQHRHPSLNLHLNQQQTLDKPEMSTTMATKIQISTSMTQHMETIQQTLPTRSQMSKGRLLRHPIGMLAASKRKLVGSTI